MVMKKNGGYTGPALPSAADMKALGGPRKQTSPLPSRLVSAVPNFPKPPSGTGSGSGSN